ncbi:hypothetical protein ACQGAO_00145 [Rhodococcus sp. 1.20]
MTAPFEPPPEDDFDPGEADYLPPDDEDYPPPSAYTPLSGGDEPNVEAPLSENLEAMVGKAVLKRIQKEADAIADAKWAEILTPELYARLEAAAAAPVAGAARDFTRQSGTGAGAGAAGRTGTGVRIGRGVRARTHRPCLSA